MAVMMSKIITGSILIMAMSCFGCSGFARVTSLRMDDNTALSAAVASGAKLSRIKTGSFSIPGYTAAYKYEISNASIAFCPGSIRTKIISVGPLIVPIIPVFIGEPEPKSDDERKRSEHLHHSVVIGIDGREAEVELDFSALRLKLMDGTPVSVTSVIALQSEACTDERYRGYRGSENLLGRKVTTKNSKKVYWIIFDTSAGDVDGLIMDLGPIIIEGERVKFPPIEYRRRHNYYYIPFYLPLPS